MFTISVSETSLKHGSPESISLPQTHTGVDILIMQGGPWGKERSSARQTPPKEVSMNLVELITQAMPQGLTLKQLKQAAPREQIDAELKLLLASGELIQVGPYYRCPIGAGVHAPARPDARRQLYRELIVEGVRAIVLLDESQALARIEELLDTHPEQDVVRAMIIEAYAQLHEGNFARYKLTHQEFVMSKG